MEIKLDHKAMEYIFQQMTEDQKLELITGVINTAIKRHVKNILTPEVKEFIDAETKSAVAEYFGTSKHEWHKGLTITLAPQIKDAISDGIELKRREMQREIEAEVGEAWTKTKRLMTEEIKNAVEAYLSDKQLTHMIRQQAKAYLAELLSNMGEIDG